ncbi:MAG: hypothetical protein DRI86_13210 [Bacteroidetes bacterium]|nr:MAG: hypothetical protein DRI86_13210 [Bacteroidota bacterium]
MIKYLKHDEIDFTQWDKCISNSVGAYIYAYSWYLDIVAGEWDALVDDDYLSVFPLPFRQKFGVKYIYQPVFTQQLGLFSTEMQGIARLNEFLQAIPKDFKLIEMNLNKYYVTIKRKNYSLVENRNLELDLAKDYEHIYKQFSTNLKRNIKKADKQELRIAEHVKPEELIALFKENKGSELNVYSPEDYVRLGRLAYMLLHKGKASIVGVYNKENTLIAAALFVSGKTRFIFLFSGLNKEGKEKAAMPFLISSFIKKYSNSNKVFDFEGSNNESLARFYKSFGAQEYHYFGLRQYRFPFKQIAKLKNKIIS